MNSRQRVAAAMNLRRPDRTPVMCQPSIGFLLRQCPDLDPIAVWHDPAAYAEALCRISRAFEFDGALASKIGDCPLDEDAIERIDRDNAEGPKVIYKNGDTTVYCRNDLPRHTFAEKREISIDDFEPDDVPEVVTYQPVSNDLNAAVATAPDERTRIFREIRDRLGDEVSVHGEVYSPYDYLIERLGVENALMSLLTHPDKSRAIMDRYARAAARFAVEQIEAGADAIKLSSPWTGQKFIALPMYEELILPGQAMIAAACRERGIPAYCHTCGAIDDRLEAIIDAGFNGLECLDPPPLGNTKLEDAVRRVGDRAFIKGNIDPVHTLLKGPPAAIEADVRHRLEVGRQARGFILSTACAIAPDTPAEHLAMVAPLARRFGAYDEG